MEEDDPHGDLQREQLKEEGLNKANNNNNRRFSNFIVFYVLRSAFSSPPVAASCATEAILAVNPRVVPD